MEERFEHLSDGEILAAIDRALDALTGDRPGVVASDREQMEVLQRSLRVDARLRAWQARLAATLESKEVVWREHGTSTSTWLVDTANLTRREAAHLTTAGERLDRFPLLAAAASSGRVLPSQVEAITSVLDHLPDHLPAETVAQAQETMIGFAATHNATELRHLSAHLLEVVAPDTAEGLQATRLEREHRHALRNRHLSLIDDHHGSLLIRGSLPFAEAQPLVRILDAYTAAGQRGLDAGDPDREYLTPGMRRADALLTIIQQHTHEALAPSHGGDRPRVVVTLSYDKLAKTAHDHGLLDGHLVATGQPVPARVLRQWLCDADLLPVVLGGPSEVLDVGRSQRLVTPAIRAAIETRDKGCVFPGCDKPPSACHAHHILPWWAGGATPCEAWPSLKLPPRIHLAQP